MEVVFPQMSAVQLAHPLVALSLQPRAPRREDRVEQLARPGDQALALARPERCRRAAGDALAFARAFVVIVARLGGRGAGADQLGGGGVAVGLFGGEAVELARLGRDDEARLDDVVDRKSTRLNSSH